MKKVSFEEDLYYIEKYDCSRPRMIGVYLRKNLSLPYNLDNSLKMNEYDAWKKTYECYLKQAQILEGKSKEILLNTENGSKKSLGSSVQIDLLDMIKEVEEENASKDK